MTDELHVETLAEELARFDRMDTTWMESAVCASTDPELFFPSAAGASPMEPKKLCLACPVRQECLAYAFAVDEQMPYPLQGVWGGTSEWDRRQMKRGIAVDLETTCAGCGGVMPAANGARYCTPKCYKRADARRRRESAA